VDEALSLSESDELLMDYFLRFVLRWGYGAISVTEIVAANKRSGMSGSWR
jgi:hypothetical protein